MFSGKIKIRQSFFVRTHRMLVRRAQFSWTLQKQKLSEVIGHRCVIIMVGGRCVMSFRFGLLSHLLMHGPGFRPRLAPVIPTLNAIADALEVIGVDAIGNKPGSPVIYCALHTFVSHH